MNAPEATVTSAALSAAWANYLATLDEMRVLTEATPRYRQNPQHRAKAYHTLMEMQAMAYNFAVAPRLSHPRIFTNSGWQTDMYCLGQNGQDFYYGVIFVDGRQTYRMRGRMGDLSLFLIQTLNGLFGEPGVKADGNYDLADFKIEADGSFEVMLSPTPQPGNWVKLDDKANYQFIILRRALTDWQGDKGDLEIKRVNPLPDNYYDADEFDEAAMAARINRASQFLRYVTNDFNINLYEWYLSNGSRQKNTLTLLPGTKTSEVGSPSANYAMAIFELAEDEALIISMDKVPDGAYWSIQIGDVWSRSLNYSTRHSSLNNAEVTADASGGFHAVISQQDPGVGNWLDTCGRLEGTIVFRNYRATCAPVPSSRKVKFSELNTQLPKDMKRITPAERQARIEYRHRGQLMMYGE